MDRRSRRELMDRLSVDTRRIATHFGLECRSIEAERANVKSRFGICYDDGSIKIRLNHSVTGEPLKYSSLVNTVCHELAHLRHFNHGPRFKAFYLQMLEWARAQGIYQPRANAPREYKPVPLPIPQPVLEPLLKPLLKPRRPPERLAALGPRQLELFGGWTSEFRGGSG